MTKRIAINGFGRIGRLVFRQFMDEPELEVVALNDVAPLDNLAYLLRYDTVYDAPDAAVADDEKALSWGTSRVPFFSERDPASLPWKDMGVDIVIESSGVFTRSEDAAKHIDAGAMHVIVTAPVKGGGAHYMHGSQ